MFTQTQQNLETGSIKLRIDYSFRGVNVKDERTFENEQHALSYSYHSKLDLIKFSFEFCVISVPLEKVKRQDFSDALDKLQKTNMWFETKDLKTVTKWIVKLKDELRMILNVSSTEEKDYTRRIVTNQLIDYCQTLLEN